MEFGVTEGLVVLAVFMIAIGTATLGSTGGLLLAILATALPPPLIIPVHAVVEGARTGFLWARIRQRVSMPILVAASMGAFLGIGLAASFVRAVPDHAQAILIGAFLFWACWWPAPDPGKRFPYRLPLMSGITGACSVFVGETGPLIRPFIADEPVDPSLVPDSVTAVAAVQHGLKVVAFVLVGIAYLPLVPLLTATVAAALLGTILGERLGLRLPARLVSLGIRLVVSVLAIRLVVLAAGWL